VSTPEVVGAWCDALIARHTESLSRPEFLKAVRALSARYVESRGQLPGRSPLDSAGKRSAFAAFYAPLHFLTVREVVRALELEMTTRLETIVDLGCGTGAAGAAWTLECPTRPAIRGVDRNAWALTEASWNWRQLGLRGSTDRGDLVDAATRLSKSTSSGRRTSLDSTGVLLGWAANELGNEDRDRLRTVLNQLADAGATVLIVEPIARRATPWWPSWVEMFGRSSLRARTDDWKFDIDLPASLANLREAAGFSERTLSARSLAVTRK
jgi:hypothetical protein